MKIAKCMSRQVTHHAEAAGEESFGQHARNNDERTGFAAIFRRCNTNALLKQIAEAAEARHADFHANFCDGMLS